MRGNKVLDSLFDIFNEHKISDFVLEVIKEKGIDASGYRLVMNTNADAGQTVFHLHMHLMGGKPLGEKEFGGT